MLWWPGLGHHPVVQQQLGNSLASSTCEESGRSCCCTSGGGCGCHPSIYLACMRTKSMEWWCQIHTPEMLVCSENWKIWNFYFQRGSTSPRFRLCTGKELERFIWSIVASKLNSHQSFASKQKKKTDITIRNNRYIAETQFITNQDEVETSKVAFPGHTVDNVTDWPTPDCNIKIS